VVPGWTKQKNLQDLISTEKKLGVVVHTCHPSNGGKHKIK
jgi:hypothetical protein